MKLDDNFFLEAQSVLREIEQECSIKILDIYESNEILQENKSDGSPVTAADLAANEIIKNGECVSCPEGQVITPGTIPAQCAPCACHR